MLLAKFFQKQIETRRTVTNHKYFMRNIDWRIFSGKEDEQNWNVREKLLNDLCSEMEISGEFNCTFMNGFRTFIHDVLSTLQSARTQLALSSARFHATLIQVSNVVDEYDSFFDILAPILVKICGSSKKLIAAAGETVISALFSKASTTKITLLVLGVFSEKNGILRGRILYTFSKILCHRKEDFRNWIDEIQPVFLKAVVDASPVVRAAALEMLQIFWTSHSFEINSMIDGLDSLTAKQVRQILAKQSQLIPKDSAIKNFQSSSSTTFQSDSNKNFAIKSNQPQILEKSTDLISNSSSFFNLKDTLQHVNLVCDPCTKILKTNDIQETNKVENYSFPPSSSNSTGKNTQSHLNYDSSNDISRLNLIASKILVVDNEVSIPLNCLSLSSSKCESPKLNGQIRSPNASLNRLPTSSLVISDRIILRASENIHLSTPLRTQIRYENQDFSLSPNSQRSIFSITSLVDQLASPPILISTWKRLSLLVSRSFPFTETLSYILQLLSCKKVPQEDIGMVGLLVKKIISFDFETESSKIWCEGTVEIIIILSIYTEVFENIWKCSPLLWPTSSSSPLYIQLLFKKISSQDHLEKNIIPILFDGIRNQIENMPEVTLTCVEEALPNIFEFWTSTMVTEVIHRRAIMSCLATARMRLGNQRFTKALRTPLNTAQQRLLDAYCMHLE